MYIFKKILSIFLKIFVDIFVPTPVPADSDLLLEFVLIDNLTALWAFLKITMDLRGIKPTPEFSPGFCLKFASPDGYTGIPLILFK